jgi:hypothetical protein
MPEALALGRLGSDALSLTAAPPPPLPAAPGRRVTMRAQDAPRYGGAEPRSGVRNGAYGADVFARVFLIASAVYPGWRAIVWGWRDGTPSSASKDP